jgi:hypothetical protein
MAIASDRGYNMKTAGVKLANQLTEKLTFSINFQYSKGDLDFMDPSYTAGKDTNSRVERILSGKLDYALSDSVSPTSRATHTQLGHPVQRWRRFQRCGILWL